jgi:hypothetical protein
MNLGALLMTQRGNNIHLRGLKKICCAHRNFDSRSEDHVGDFLQLAGSHA